MRRKLGHSANVTYVRRLETVLIALLWQGFTLPWIMVDAQSAKSKHPLTLGSRRVLGMGGSFIVHDQRTLV